MHRILCLLLLAGVLSARPVALVVSPSAMRLRELLLKTVFNPQWDTQKPAVSILPWSNVLDDAHDYSAVIYLLGGGRDVSARKLLSADNDWSSTLDYVRQGGRVFFIGDGCIWPENSNLPAGLQQLLGADQLSPLNDTARVLNAADPLLAGAGAHPDCGKHMLQGTMTGLTNLAGAQPHIGNDEANILTSNELGQGKVFFCNVRLTTSFTSFPQPYHQTANASLEQLFPFTKMLHKAILENKPQLLNEKREAWLPEPRGPKRENQLPTKPRAPQQLQSNRIRKDLPGKQPLLLKENDQNLACILIADGRSSLTLAARRLAKASKVITGEEWPIITEKKMRIKQDDGDKRVFLSDGQEFKAVISLGETELARAANLLAERVLADEEIHIACGEDVIVLESPNLSLAVETFLREYLTYRRLWPGELGEAFIAQATISIPQGIFSDQPAIPQRGIRNGLSSGANTWKTPGGEEVKVPRSARFINGCNRLDIDPRDTLEPLQEHGSWWPAQRLGGRLPIGGGGSFYSWPKRFADHPEYFALQFDGTRDVHESHARVCKSSPQVIKQAAEDILALKERQSGMRYFALSPSDGGSWDIFCFCPTCRSWDPQTDISRTWRVFLGRNRPVFQYPGMTDRVLRFTCEVARQVQAVDPDLTPIYLAYSSYASPPLYYQDIPENFMVSYVGLQYFNDQALTKDRADWDFWAGISKELQLRPNLLLQGHGMPCVYVTKLDRDIKHCWQTGMISADFDSLTHHWATSGLNFYVLAQLLWDPAQKLEDIIEDYCRIGFGEGADDVKRYFALCEQVTDQLAANDAEEVSQLEDLSNRTFSLTEKIPYYYTPAVLTKMRAALESAQQKTDPESKERKRVEFLLTGLEYGEREAEFLRLYQEKAENRKELKEYVTAHVEFLRTIYWRHPFAVNVPAIAHSTWPMWRSCHLWQ